MLDTFHDWVSQGKRVGLPLPVNEFEHWQSRIVSSSAVGPVRPKRLHCQRQVSLWSHDVSPYSVHACLTGEVGYAVAKPNEIGDLEKHEALLPQYLT